MKFAKIIFFICVIGICSALERATTKSEAKSEAEYTASTKSLRVVTGYKEMSSNSNALDSTVYAENFPVDIKIGYAKSFSTILQMTLLKTNSFLSGIPFYAKDGVSLTTPVMKNFLKLPNTNTFYIPYNTITEGCSFHSNMMDTTELYAKIKCPLNNSNGTAMLVMSFTNIGDDYQSQQKVLLIQQVIDSGKSSRKQMINGELMKVNMAVYGVNNAKGNIESINKSDAEVKKAKIASITALKTELTKLQAELNGLKKKKITLSNDLQNIKTKQNDLSIKKKSKITIKISLLANIETMAGKITSKDIIGDLTKKQADNMDLLKYWLQGSVYHRMITGAEKDALIGLVAKDTQFDTKVTELFFPQ